MKVKDIKEFKENRDIANLLSDFERELKLHDDPFYFDFDDITAQTETYIADIGLIGIEIVKQSLGVFDGPGTRVDLYTKMEDEWARCFSMKIDTYSTIPQGVWETIAAYREKLERQKRNEKKRKYRRGDPIHSLDELMDQDFVYWHDKIYARGWFASWQLNMVHKQVTAGKIFRAIRKDDNNV